MSSYTRLKAYSGRRRSLAPRYTNEVQPSVVRRCSRPQIYVTAASGRSVCSELAGNLHGFTSPWNESQNEASKVGYVVLTFPCTVNNS